MRKEVIIETFNPDASAMVYSGRVVLEDGIVSFVDCPVKFIEEMNTFGVVGLARHGQVFPRDGEKFLDALRLECNRTSFVRARRSR